MAAPKVRADYDELGRIKKLFRHHADSSRATLSNLRNAKDALQGGDWVGQGATAFFREMDSDVLPRVQRLVAALERAEQVVQSVSQIVKHAEDEVAKIFSADSHKVLAVTGSNGGSEATDQGTINFGANADQDAVSDHSRQVLRDIMKAAGLDSVSVTSTSRTPQRQAIAMFDNIESQGVDSQKKLYGSYGDQVIDVYVAEKAAGKSRAEIISAMETKINDLGPSNISRHLADPTKKNVIDIAPSQISDKDAFEKAVEADSRVSKFLKPPKDSAYHLEIPQPTK
jgi:WXG100 family type VII secretion target